MMVLFAILLIGGVAVEPPQYRSYRASYLDCYDGDTCDFRLHLGLDVTLRQTVRFLGVDTPEMRGATRAAAIVARDFVIQRLQAARRIELRVPQKATCRWTQDDCDKRGRYGRLLADVVADGASINAALLQKGYAAVY